MINGSYVLRNETKFAISRLWVSLDQTVSEYKIAVDGFGETTIDRRFKQQWITLRQPLKPGELKVMRFALTIFRNGFMPFDSENSLTANGSYIEVEKFVPNFGYDAGREVKDSLVRRQMGLRIKNATYKEDKNYHRIAFESTISAPAEQQIVTVGTLRRTWTANGRNYFHYKAEQPIEFMFALSAAAYAVKKVRYNDVEINLFHLKGQEYNTETILQTAKDVISYGNRHFSRYLGKQFTLAEIPQYRGAATAYPGVVFAADQICFLGDFRDPNTVNQAYTVIAHEVAHQWWANQLTPANAAGSPTLTESLAKFTEAIVTEKKFGKIHMRKHFKADNQLYFLNRDRNGKEEPLATVTDQPYVYYQKGGLVLYAIREMIGEQAMNQALQRLLRNHGYPQSRATTNDLVAELCKQATPQQVSLINDWMNKVLTYQLKVKVLSCRRQVDGKYSISLEAETSCLNSNGKQVATKELEVDLGVFGQPENEWNKNTKPIYLKKHRFTQAKTLITLIVDAKPKTVAIDPFAYLLDENLNDNIDLVR